MTMSPKQWGWFQQFVRSGVRPDNKGAVIIGSIMAADIAGRAALHRVNQKRYQSQRQAFLGRPLRPPVTSAAGPIGKTRRALQATAEYMRGLTLEQNQELRNQADLTPLAATALAGTSLLRSHPPTAKRIARLEEIGRKMGVPKPPRPAMAAYKPKPLPLSEELLTKYERKMRPWRRAGTALLALTTANALRHQGQAIVRGTRARRAQLERQAAQIRSQQWKG